MVNRGKAHMLEYQDFEIKQLRECFNSLDKDGTGGLGVEELKGPLIGLGLVSLVNEIQKMIDAVDEDESGEIEFNEFLHIVQDNGNGAIAHFFKNFVRGKFKLNGLPFSNFVLKKQRGHIISALIEPKYEEESRSKGRKILTATRNMLLDEQS